MIKCNSCNEWFHQSCIHIDDKFFSYRHLSWNCLTCTK
jgi:hypothetical protein